jgi:hypothetical protein
MAAESSTSSLDTSCAARISFSRLPAPACRRVVAKSRCARPFSIDWVVTST